MIFYYRCKNCGQIYYSAAELSGKQLVCDKCGGIIEKVDQKELKKEDKRKEGDE